MNETNIPSETVADVPIELVEKFDPNSNHVKPKELRRFCIGLMGQNMVYGLIGTTVLQYFLTDVLFIPGAAVIVLMILSRVWDGINDPIVGSFIDKHQFKNGEKLRPFLKWAPLPIGILSVLLFIIPINNPANNQVWINVTYFITCYLIWDVLYTVQDVPIWSMTAMMTPNSSERDKVVWWARICGSTMFGIASTIIPLLIEIAVNAFGLKWSQSYLLFAVLFGLGGALISRNCHYAKERVPVQNKQESIKDSLSLLLKNKVMLLLSLSNILSAIGFGGALSLYFFKYMIPADFYKIPLIGFMGASVIFGTLTYAPTFIAMFMVPKFKKWFGNSMMNVIIFAQIANIVFRIIAFFIGFEGNRLWFSTILLALAAFPSGALGIANTSIFNDSIDYIEWQTGKRTEGVVFSMQTLLTKVSSGITAGLSLLFLYAVLKYVPSPESVTETIGYQGETFEKWIWPLFILSPALGSLLYIIPLKWAKYPKNLQNIVEADLAARREGLPESHSSPFYEHGKTV